jgi:hypothetical protein
VWGQCTDALQAKVESSRGFDAIHEASDGIEVLEVIKTIAFNFQGQKYLPHPIHEAKRRFFLLYQSKTMTVQEYLEQFNNNRNMLDIIGATISPDASITNAIISDELSYTESGRLAR